MVLRKKKTAFGQELTAIGAITDKFTVDQIGLHLDSMIDKLSSLKSGNTTASHNALKKLVAAALDQIKLVGIGTEKEFKVDMKSKGNKLACKQKELQEAMRVLMAEHPGLENTASGQSSGKNEVETMYEAACDAAATLTEYSCVYVAMMSVNNPKLKDPGQVGQRIRQAIASALLTLNANRRANIFLERADEMQATLDTAVEGLK